MGIQEITAAMQFATMLMVIFMFVEHIQKGGK